MKLLFFITTTVFIIFHAIIAFAKNLKRADYDDEISRFQIFIAKDPREVTDPRTHILALKQTINARNLMYFPNENLVNFLKEAAGKLFMFVNSLDTHLIRALGARILNREGILFGQTEKDFTDSLKRVAGFLSNPTANDRIVCIALMGDIGTMYLTAGATTEIIGRTPEQAQMLKNQFKEFTKKINNGVDYFTENVINKIRLSRGSSAVGPNKSKERTRINDESRTGIFNYGNRADEILDIEASHRIVKTNWAVALIDDIRLNAEEPWTAHMSGSPTEILYAWDSLTSENPLESFINENSIDTRNHLNNEKRAAKAAGASAFLIAMGYHSALECIEASMAYLGQNLRISGFIKSTEDAGNLLHNDASTKIMSELFIRITRQDKVFNFSN
jgi:hypothetical protein